MRENETKKLEKATQQKQAIKRDWKKTNQYG